MINEPYDYDYVDGDKLWIKNPEFVIDTGLVSHAVCDDEREINMVWDCFDEERLRISREAVSSKHGYASNDRGYNVLYTLPNGHKVLDNNCTLYGRCRMIYEYEEDCKSDKYKEWLAKRNAARGSKQSAKQTVKQTFVQQVQIKSKPSVQSSKKTAEQLKEERVAAIIESLKPHLPLTKDDFGK